VSVLVLADMARKYARSPGWPLLKRLTWPQWDGTQKLC